MSKLFLSITLLWLGIIPSVLAVSMSAKEKYPNPLITEDYDILNEIDLAAFTWGLKPRPFTSDEISGRYTYWQCFPRESISITLKDTGYSSEDIGWKDNYGNLVIRVVINPHLAHEYSMRSNWTVKESEQTFNVWRKLMWKEKYVCLAGGFSRREREIIDGNTKELYLWTFEKIKTKKGCDSYFDKYDDCHPSYSEYLRQNARHDKGKNST